MPKPTHPSIEQLKDFVDNPTSRDAQRLGLHLAQCPSCRSRADSLSTMQRHIGSLASEAYQRRITDAELGQMFREQSIERFLEDELEHEPGHKVRSKIASDRLALKAALHYASHSAAMKKNLKKNRHALRPGRIENSVPQDMPLITSLWSSVKRWFSLRPPVWVTVPATALATGLMIFAIVLMNQPSPGRIAVADYRDSAVIELQPKSKAPGMGFFNHPSKKTALFDDVRVALLKRDTIKISWPVVPQAKAYVMRLSAIVDGMRAYIDEKTTVDTTIVFKGLEITPGHRYEWVLSGETTNNESFTAKGGFVFYRKN